VSESSEEAIASARGVDDADLRGTNAQTSVFFGQDSARPAQRDDDCAAAVQPLQPLRRAESTLQIIPLNVNNAVAITKHSGFRFVDANNVSVLPKQIRQFVGSCGGKVEHRNDASSARSLQRGDCGFHRYLVLRKESRGTRKHVGGGCNVGGREQHVGSWNNDDGVLSRGGDHDGRYAAAVAGSDVHTLALHPPRPKIRNRCNPHTVVTDARKHLHLRAQQRRGDGLIGAFAAKSRGVSHAKFGLSKLGQRIDGGYLIEHAGANNGNAPRHGELVAWVCLHSRRNGQERRLSSAMQN
jgi:hypothetical protein